MRLAALNLLALALAGCQLTQEQPLGPHSSELTPFDRNSPEWAGLKFARNRCADCHAVERDQASPNPAAPTFVAIANRPGMDRQGLSNWLAEGHDYPDQMYFEIPAEHIDELVAYVVTLKAQEQAAGD